MQRFAEACKQQRHTLRTLDILSTTLVISKGKPHVWAAGEPVFAREVDVVIPRIGTAVTQEGCTVLGQFEAMGLPVANGSAAILQARDKLRCLQRLTSRGIDVPATAIVREVADLDDALEMVGGVPCVVKLLEGTQGIGVMLAESREGLEAMLQAFWSLGHSVLLQQFIAESRGRDVRAFVVGDEVVAAMRREAPLGEFRSNIHRGGTGTAVKLDAKQKAAMVEATQALGLHVAGVDFLESNAGPLVIEVNASPGFEGLEKATGVDVAGAVVRYAAKLGKKGGP